MKQVWTGSATLFFNLDYGLTYFDFLILKYLFFGYYLKKKYWNIIPAIFENQTISEFELAYCDNAEPTRKLTNEASPVKINGNGSNCNSDQKSTKKAQFLQH